MFIINRYLLRQFGQIFVICFVSLMGLYVVIDAFGHLDQFASRADGQGGLLAAIATFYAYQSLAFFDRASGAIAMIAAMFTVAWLQRHNELTAIMASGVSKFRIIKPLLLAAAAVSLLGVANRELVVPRFRDEVARDSKDLGGVAARDLEPRFDARTDVLIGGAKIVLAEQKILAPAFVLPPALSRYGKQLVAAEARTVDADDNHPAGFILAGVSTPKQIVRLPSLWLGDLPVVVTPVDAPWLKADEVFVASEMPFSLLASGSTWRSFAGTGELIDQLHHPTTDLGPEVRVAVHARFVQPLKDGTLLMLGLPLMLSRRQRNIFVSIGVCVGVAAAFSAFELACQSLGGVSALRPSLAAWMPLLVFVPVAAALSLNLRT